MSQSQYSLNPHRPPPPRPQFVQSQQLFGGKRANLPVSSPLVRIPLPAATFVKAATRPLNQSSNISTITQSDHPIDRIMQPSLPYRSYEMNIRISPDTSTTTNPSTPSPAKKNVNQGGGITNNINKMNPVESLSSNISPSPSCSSSLSNMSRHRILLPLPNNASETPTVDENERQQKIRSTFDRFRASTPPATVKRNMTTPTKVQRSRSQTPRSCNTRTHSRVSYNNSSSSSTSTRSMTPSAMSTCSSATSTSHATSSCAEMMAESNFIMAICEFRSHHIVGLVVMDMNHRRLYMSQYGDGQTYAQTAQWVAHFLPKEILVTEKQVDSPLLKRLKDDFGRLIHFTSVRRRYFNESLGLMMIRSKATHESLVKLNLDTSMYLCVSAANCLIQYREFAGAMTFAPSSLEVHFVTLSGRVDIDLLASNSLELLPVYGPADVTTIEMNAEMSLLYPPSETLSRSRGGSGNIVSVTSAGGMRRRKNKLCLMDIFHPRTAMGARLLRNSLLQPFNDANAINVRLDMVELFLLDEESYFSLIEMLPQMSDLDQLIGAMIQIPTNLNDVKESIHFTQRMVNLIKTLGQSLELLPLLHHAAKNLRRETENIIQRRMKQSHHLTHLSGDDLSSSSGLLEMLSSLISTLSSLHYTELRHHVLNILELAPIKSSHKSNLLKERYKVAFAVRSGWDGLLDVARATLQEAVQGLEHECVRLSAGFQLSRGVLQLAYTGKLGYHLSIPKQEMDRLHQDDAKQLRMIGQRGQRLLCVNDRIASLQSRQEEAYVEVVQITKRAIQDTLQNIQQHLDWLARVSESIGWIDLTTTFAELITTSPHTWVRPTFTVTGPMVIKAGRHPLMQDQLQEAMVPNDSFMDESTNLCILTGANGSGKTSYLRMVGVINVLAHIGCFVPAKSATIRLTDAIRTRMDAAGIVDHDDCSTFFRECKEVAQYIHTDDRRVLVLIDELGRSTHSLDGISIAWAICEHLLRQSNTFTLISTHFIELCQLCRMYSNARCKHLEVELSSGRLLYKFKMSDGPMSAEVEQYGIAVAEQAGFKQTIIQDAKSTYTRLKATMEQPALNELENGDAPSESRFEHRENNPTKQMFKELRRSILSDNVSSANSSASIHSNTHIDTIMDNYHCWHHSYQLPAVDHHNNIDLAAAKQT